MADPFATPVRAYMTTPLVSVPVDAQLDYVLHVLEHRGISCVAVAGADGAPAGIVSTTDLLRAAKFDEASASSSRSRSSGLVRKSSIPAARQASRSAAVTFAVSAIIRVRGAPVSAS